MTREWSGRLIRLGSPWPVRVGSRHRWLSAWSGGVVLAMVSAALPVRPVAATGNPVGLVTTYRTGVDHPQSIAAGSDGALWFTNSGDRSIGRITTAGVISDYSGPGISGQGQITSG